MIKHDTVEWTNFVNKIQAINAKTNKETLCLKCWKMLHPK